MTFLQSCRRTWIVASICTACIVGVHIDCSAQDLQPQPVTVSQDILLVSDEVSNSGTTTGLVQPLAEYKDQTIAKPLPRNDFHLEETVTQLANPAGPILRCADIAGLVQQSSNAATSTEAKKQHASCNSHPKGNTTPEFRRCLALIEQRLVQTKIRDALKAHVVILASTSLAIEQATSSQRIKLLAERQQAAIENGLPIRDIGAIDRLRLQVIDSVIQNQGVNLNARGQLRILTNSQIVCDYRPQYERDYVQIPEDLCTAINIAIASRRELQVLAITSQWLRSHDVDVPSCQSILQQPILSPAILASSSHSNNPLVNLIRGRSIRQEQINALTVANETAKETLRTKIAAEATDAWHQVETNRKRTAVAVEMHRLNEEQVQLLNQLGNEIGVSAEELLQADLQERESAIELVLRQQELDLSQIELAHVCGQF